LKSLESVRRDPLSRSYVAMEMGDHLGCGLCVVLRFRDGDEVARQANKDTAIDITIDGDIAF